MIAIYRNLLFLALTLFLGVFSACARDEAAQVTVTGTVVKQQALTTYQYGTYGIEGHAIKSEGIDLEQYVNKKVQATGEKIEGYPVDGGPEYLEITKIKLKE